MQIIELPLPLPFHSCLKVLEPDPVDLASVGLGGADGSKGKGPSNGNPDDARWSGEARCGNTSDGYISVL